MARSFASVSGIPSMRESPCCEDVNDDDVLRSEIYRKVMYPIIGPSKAFNSHLLPSSDKLFVRERFRYNSIVVDESRCTIG